jgi:hypothetical protein
VKNHLNDLWNKNSPEYNGDYNVEAHGNFSGEHSWCLAPFGKMSQYGKKNGNS